jgi:hypothetical protein
MATVEKTARETGSFAAACSVKLQGSEVCDAMISLQETEVKRILNFFEESGRIEKTPSVSHTLDSSL